MNKAICLHFKQLSQCKKTETRNSICLHLIKITTEPDSICLIYSVYNHFHQFMPCCVIFTTFYYLNQANRHIKIKNKFLPTDYANLSSRQLQNEELQKLHCNIKINLSNATSRAASWTVLQRAMMPKQARMQRHCKVK